MKPSEKVNVFLEQLNDRLKELEMTDHIIKTAYSVGQHPKDGAKLPEFEDEEDVLDFCRDLSSRLIDVENYRNPQNIQNKVQFQFQLIEEMSNTMSQIMQKLKMLDFDERFIELFTDDDIKAYYMNSGLTASDVKKFVDKAEGKDISMPTISLYVNAKIADLQLRSILGNYFKHEAIKKTKKDH